LLHIELSILANICDILYDLQVKEINAVDHTYDKHGSYVNGKYKADNYSKK
jgi:hypothetical protein